MTDVDQDLIAYLDHIRSLLDLPRVMLPCSSRFTLRAFLHATLHVNQKGMRGLAYRSVMEPPTARRPSWLRERWNSIFTSNASKINPRLLVSLQAPVTTQNLDQDIAPKPCKMQRRMWSPDQIIEPGHAARRGGIHVSCLGCSEEE